MNKSKIAIICVTALCAQNSHTMDEITTTFAQLNSANTVETRNAYAKTIAGLLVSEESLDTLHNQRPHPALKNPDILDHPDVYRCMPGTWIERLNIERRDSVITAAFSPDGKEVATGAGACDAIVKMMNVQTGEQAGEIKQDDKITLVTYSADHNKILVVAGKKVNVYDAKTHASVYGLECADYVNTAAFAADSQHLIIGADTKTSQIYNFEKRAHMPLNCKYPVWDAKFSPDNSMYMLSELGGENPVHIFGIHPGIFFGETSDDIGSIAHNSTPCVAAFSPNSQMVVTGSADKTAKIVRIDKKNKILDLLHTIQHGDIVLSAAFSPNNDKVITTSGDKTARVTDVETGTPLVIIQHGDIVFTGMFSANGQSVATASADKTGKITNVATGETEHVIAHTDRVISATFACKEDMVVTASDDNTSKVVQKVTHSTLQALAMKYVQWCHTHNKGDAQTAQWIKDALKTYPNPDEILKAVIQSKL